MPGGTYRILAIDGGAMMGVVPARILSYLDNSVSATPFATSAAVPSHLTGNLCDHFDLIVGTSTGGIMAAGLGLKNLTAASPMNANGLLNLYAGNGKTIFENHYNGDAKYNGPLFQPEGLRSVLKANFGDPATDSTIYTMKDLAGGAEVLITSFNMNPGDGWSPTTQIPLAGINSAKFGPVALNAATLDDTGDTSRSLSALDACMMTSAFPMLFPPHTVGAVSKTTPFFGDGGLYAGNPMMVGYLYARTVKQMSDDQIVMVSVGCGDYTPPTGFGTTPALTLENANSFGEGFGYFLYHDVASIAGKLIADEVVKADNRKPGWLVSQIVSSPDSPPNDSSKTYEEEFGYLTALLGAGAGNLNGELLARLLGDTTGSPRFFRLQPPLDQGTDGNSTYYPPYDWTGTDSNSAGALSFWVKSADAYIAAYDQTRWNTMTGLLNG